MIYIIILLIFLITLFIIIIAMACRKSTIKNLQKRTNEKARQLLQSTNFDVTNMYFLNDFATYDKTLIFKKVIFIDNKNEQIAFVNYKKAGVTIAKFKDILNYEVYENGSSITFGAVFVGLVSAETEGRCKDLRLIIRLNNIENPHVTYDFVTDTVLNLGISKSSDGYRACVSTLQEIVSFLEVIKSQNNSKQNNNSEL